VNNKQFIQKLYFFEALKEFLLIYAHSNIGGEIEIDVEEVANYLESERFLIQIGMNKYTRDEIFKLLEEDLLSGMPVWKFLKLTKFQYNYLKVELEELSEYNNRKIQADYLCPTCIFYEISETSFGTHITCKTTGYLNQEKVVRGGGASRFRASLVRRGGNDLPVKECKDYIKR